MLSTSTMLMLAIPLRQSRIRETRPCQPAYCVPLSPYGTRHVAKPNYQFEKRQRELQKKRKKEAKSNRKSPPADSGDGQPASDAPGDATTESGTSGSS